MSNKYLAIISLIAVILASMTAPAFAQVVKTPGDDDEPQIKLLDQTIIEGTYRYTVAMKDASTITGKSLTYTRYDPLFEEYDEFTVALTPTSTTNIYYADINVAFPQTTIKINANDAWANTADTITKRYKVLPSVLDMSVTLPDLRIAYGEDNFSVVVRNNYDQDVDLKVVIQINGLSDYSSYQDTISTEIGSKDEKTLKVPFVVDQRDSYKEFPITITLKAFGIEKSFQNTIVFESDRERPSFDEVKPRYDSQLFTGDITLDATVSRIVFILPTDATVITPSNTNLVNETLELPQNRWSSARIIDNQDIPIDIQVYKFYGGNRSIFIIDVPEIGTYHTDGMAKALIRYYS